MDRKKKSEIERFILKYDKEDCVVMFISNNSTKWLVKVTIFLNTVKDVFYIIAHFTHGCEVIDLSQCKIIATQVKTFLMKVFDNLLVAIKLGQFYIGGWCHDFVSDIFIFSYLLSKYLHSVCYYKKFGWCFFFFLISLAF